MFGLLKLLFFVLWLIGLSQGRATVDGAWHQTPEPDPTIFENQSAFDLELQLNDIDTKEFI